MPGDESDSPATAVAPMDAAPELCDPERSD
jgi:hypothetical protein